MNKAVLSISELFLAHFGKYQFYVKVLSSIYSPNGLALVYDFPVICLCCVNMISS